MTESKFLSGAVSTWSLPLIHGRPAPEAPRLKRLRLPQGDLDHFYDGPQGIQYIAHIELTPGTVRGNHFHKVREEFVYLVSGELVIRVQDTRSAERASFKLFTGDLMRISPLVAHAFETVVPGHGIEFAPCRFDPADIHKLGLL